MSDGARTGEFAWSDAWILLAAGLAAKTGPSTLAHILGAADAVQHAVPTIEELDGALRRLQRAGYIELASDGAHLTAVGLRLMTDAERAGRTLSALQTALEQAIGAPSWTPAHDPRSARAGEVALVTQAEYDAAVQRYYKLVGYRP